MFNAYNFKNKSICHLDRTLQGIDTLAKRRTWSNGDKSEIQCVFSFVIFIT